MLSKLFHFYLRKTNLQRFAEIRGVRFGNGCKVVASLNTSFGTEPYLISIGDHVEIAADVTFVTHDGGVWVLRETNPDIDVFGRIDVGNNVFIGRGAMLLPGVSLGNNTVVGARSLLKGNYSGNSVYAGVPARRICSFEAYRDKSVSAGLPTKGLNAAEKRDFLINRLKSDNTGCPLDE